MKYARRTDEDRIAELAAKIEGIRERAARRPARANPAVRQATIAFKAIEMALKAQPGEPLGPALEQAAVALQGALHGVVGASVAEVGAEPKRRARAKVPME